MWLRWRHGFAYGLQSWEWTYFEDNEDTKDEILGFIERRAEEYNYSDKYRGIQYDTFPTAPKWVLEAQLREAEEDRARAIASYERKVRALTSQTAHAQPCKQCGDAPIEDNYQKATKCPYCGRRVGNLRFLLLPSQKKELTLLRSLVEKGERVGKGNKQLLTKSERAVYQALIDRGLAGGTYSANEERVFATEKGKIEWAKHKEAS